MGLLFFEVGEDGAEFLVGGDKAAAAFGYQLGGAACEGGKAVDVAIVALHQAQDSFEFGYGLVVCEFLDWRGVHWRFDFFVSEIFEVIVPSASVVSIIVSGARSLTDVTACPLTRVME